MKNSTGKDETIVTAGIICNVRVLKSKRGELSTHAGKRRRKILLNVVTERLKRGNVQDFGLIGKLSGAGLAHQRVDRGEKGRQSFARSRGRGNENVAAGLDLRPAQTLWLGGRGEAGVEPALD